jgi:hypothetical protein
MGNLYKNDAKSARAARARRRSSGKFPDAPKAALAVPTVKSATPASAKRMAKSPARRTPAKAAADEPKGWVAELFGGCVADGSSSGAARFACMSESGPSTPARKNSMNMLDMINTPERS